MVAGRHGHNALCRAGVAAPLAFAITPHPHSGASNAVVAPQGPATVIVVQV